MLKRVLMPIEAKSPFIARAQPDLESNPECTPGDAKGLHTRSPLTICAPWTRNPRTRRAYLNIDGMVEAAAEWL